MGKRLLARSLITLTPGNASSALSASSSARMVGGAGEGLGLLSSWLGHSQQR